MKKFSIRQIRHFFQRSARKQVYKTYIRFSHSIYGRVVFIIASSLLILFILFNIVFRTVYTELFDVTIKQTGDRVSSIVEGALYYSMLENDKTMLQRELDNISKMTGINEVNMYNEFNQLAYTSLSAELKNKGDPNCTACHGNFNDMFSETDKEYRIIENHPDCGIFQSKSSERNLIIRKPIQNEPSCYTAACHAHNEDEQVLGSLIINLPLNDFDTFLDNSSRDFLLLAFMITGFMITFLVVFTRRRIKDPLNSIIKASRAVAEGDTSIRIKPGPHLLDDMRLMSEAFNNMLDNIDQATEELQNWSQQLEYKVRKKSEALSEAQNELIHVERIASLGKLSSSVAHEINNPLSGILVYSKLVQKQLSNVDFQHPKRELIIKNLKLIESETKRCGEIVKGLLDFSRKDQDDFENANLHQVLEETYKLMAHTVKMARITFNKEFNAGEDLVFCNKNQMKQAMVALLVNATEAITENGEIVIRTYNEEDSFICVEVQDNGIGISEEGMSHIFEPFYSTKRETSGIGLGLSIVHGIVDNHKGIIKVISAPGKGTKIKILLPLTRH